MQFSIDLHKAVDDAFVFACVAVFIEQQRICSKYQESGFFQGKDTKAHRCAMPHQ
jgi:hypothetical protein